MRFEEKLNNKQYDAIWQEYCGFLDLNMDEYMQIQNRLMLEQISLWSRCELGKQFLNGACPKTIEEFRQAVPLTTYEDYADILLQKKADMLPDTPIIWIQTTWEGGKHPIKVAPYTRGMLDTYRNNIMTCFILSTTTEKGKINVAPDFKILYGLAPLPYLTGLFPLALDEEITVEFLPPVKQAEKMSFGERNKKGFKLGLRKGIDLFFGMGSVAYFVSLGLSSLGSGDTGGGKKGSVRDLSPVMLVKYLAAKHRCKKEGRALKPKDIFTLKGLLCAGTDCECFKDDLEDLWGVRPMEVFAGTEPTCIGTETWSRNGLYFFPDACFYEFIPEEEMNRNLDDKTYNPKAYLINEVVPGQNYELVITVFKGGVFARYRVGDVYQCIEPENAKDYTKLPRFRYIDRVPSVIDIAGFTRITEGTLANVIKLSGLAVEDWFAVKEYTKKNRPLLHMYIEMKLDSLVSTAVTKEVIKEHLSVYFKYLDNDYKDLKRILGMDPLEVTIVRCGTFEEYKRRTGKTIRRINPPFYEAMEMIKMQDGDYKLTEGL